MGKLFCKHAYVHTKDVYAGQEEVEIGSIIVGGFSYELVNKYYRIYQCIKCGKIKTEKYYK